MRIMLFNTMTRKKELFAPVKEGNIGLYTCGPTVYNIPHIGNLRTFVFEDLLHRWLEYRGFKVHHVMNLTDVDDKTIKNSILNKMSLAEYTSIYKKEFFKSIETLNFKPAEYYPAATDYVPDMIEMIKDLVEKGFAYEAADGVYYKISSFPGYGRLAHIDRSSLKAGASGRMDRDEYAKDQVSDFALWKKWVPEDGDVRWDSPFGPGRPGWHIECSVMSMKLLGKTVDIHCGGIDNLFPHHENEIAQSEAYTGVKFVNYWMHSAHLLVDGEKMSKSKGNFYTVSDLMKKDYPARALRYALISTHYRKPLNFTFLLLKQAESSLKRIDDFLFDLEHIERTGNPDDGFLKALEKAVTGFNGSLDDDLNISEALSALFNLISYYYDHKENAVRHNSDAMAAWVKKACEVLGLIKPEAANVLTPDVEKLIDERKTAKKNGDYGKADGIRKKLLEMGVELRDTKEGVVWKRLK